MGDLLMKKQQNQLNKIDAQEKKNNFRGIFSLTETLKSFSWTRPKTRGYYPRVYGNTMKLPQSWYTVNAVAIIFIVKQPHLRSVVYSSLTTYISMGGGLKCRAPLKWGELSGS